MMQPFWFAGPTKPLYNLCYGWELFSSSSEFSHSYTFNLTCVPLTKGAFSTRRPVLSQYVTGKYNFFACNLNLINLGYYLIFLILYTFIIKY
jgi:hypothetical protein